MGRGFFREEFSPFLPVVVILAVDVALARVAAQFRFQVREALAAAQALVMPGAVSYQQVVSGEDGNRGVKLMVGVKTGLN